MAPTSPLPVKVGRVSLVVSPLASVLVAAPTSSTTVITTGASGAAVSTFSVKAGEVPERLPAASVALTRRSCEPGVRSVPGIKLQLPLSLTKAVPISTPLSRICTVLPATPVPVSSGRVSLVTWPLVSGPVLPSTLSLMLTITGVAGGVMSTNSV